MATNVVASWLPKRRPNGAPTARANFYQHPILKQLQLTIDFFLIFLREVRQTIIRKSMSRLQAKQQITLCTYFLWILWPSLSFVIKEIVLLFISWNFNARKTTKNLSRHNFFALLSLSKSISSKLPRARMICMRS